MRYSKPFLSIPDQIQLLQQRGMIIADVPYAKHCLSNISYSRLRTYWHSFEANYTTHQFQPNTTFEEVMRLYQFDSQLRQLLLTAVESVEVSLRTQVNYHFADMRGEFAYTRVGESKNREFFQRNMKTLKDELNRSKDVSIQHYKQKYTSPPMPPIWIACEAMSFGLLSRWYKNIRSAQVRQTIAAAYQVDNRALDGILHNLTEIRNVVAHHGRTWDRNFVARMPIPRSKPSGLRANVNVNDHDHLYNSLVMLIHLLRVVEPANRWMEAVRDAVDQFEPNEPKMGFPAQWRQLPIWTGGTS